MPDSRKRSTIVSSERIADGSSASISCLMWWRTASAECASPPSAEAIEAVKKYFSSKVPRLVAMYLLADDFGCDLQDGTGALIERAHEPCRILQAVGEIGFVAILADRLGELGVIGLVDQDARQRVAVELDMPAAVGPRPDIDVRDHGLHPRRAEFQSRLRIEAADFTDH